MFKTDSGNPRKLIRKYPTYTVVKYYRDGKTPRTYNTFKKRLATRLKLGACITFLIFLAATPLINKYYEVVDTTKVSAQTPIVSPLPKEKAEVTLTPEQEQDWEAMKRMARKLAPLYDYPVNVVISQMALESARGTSHYCQTRNNCFGIGAYDSNPDQAFWFENKEQGIIEYMRLIKAYYSDAYASRQNPDEMIRLIKANGYATDPNYVQKITSLPEWTEN